MFLYILTFDEDVVRQCKNAYNHTFGSIWVKEHDYSKIDIQLKKFQVSMVCGTKNQTSGHLLRHDVYLKQREFKTPCTIFRSNRGGRLPDIQNNQFLPEDNKIHLFKNFQFSIVIENSQQSNYFTEKLIDCLITKTIPVYWGCPNIGTYFDTTGWVFFKDSDDLIEKLNALDDTYYSKYSDIVSKNYETVKNYIDFHKNINRVLRVLPNY